MNPLYLVTKNYYVEHRQAWESEPLFCFEVLTKAEEYVHEARYRSDHKLVDYSIELVRVIK